MKLYFCPQCRYPSAVEDVCLLCNLPRDAQAAVQTLKVMARTRERAVVHE
jgi:hypothetical protein